MNDLSNKGVVPSGTAPFVFWDGYGLELRHSGVAHVASMLFQELSRMGVVPRIIANDPVFFAPQSTLTLPKRFPNKLTDSKLLWPQRSFAEVMRQQKQLNKRVVFHGLANLNLPVGRKDRNIAEVLTVHDLTPLIASDKVSKFLEVQLRIALRYLVKTVDRFVCVSRWSEESLQRFYPETKGRTVVIPNGRSSDFVGKSPKKDEKKRVLTVARFEPYKNLKIIPGVLAGLDASFEYHLVTDRRGTGFFQSEHRELVQAGRLILHTDIDDAALQRLFRQSDCYVQTSFYEGFCLPVMQAMSCGLPVVYVSGSAIGEIVSGETSVSVVDGNSSKQLLEAIYLADNIGNSPGFAEKVKTHFLGRPSWDNAAQNLKSLYTEIL